MKNLVNLIVLAALGAAAWYGYTNYVGSGSDSEDPSAPQGFNCRGALARLAQDYECRDAADCTFTTEDQAALTQLESDIERYCN